MKRTILAIRYSVFLPVFALFMSGLGGAAGSAVAADPLPMPDPETMRQMMPQMMSTLNPGGLESSDDCRVPLHGRRGERGLSQGLDRLVGNSGGMGETMDQPFFLDRIEELGLSPEQVSELKEIRAVCRRDNIRAAAEARIKRLELVDLLEGEWTVAAAEKVIRDIQKLKGDIQVRHLMALKEAHKVLNEEQLRQLDAGESGSIEHLFH